MQDNILSGTPIGVYTNRKWEKLLKGSRKTPKQIRTKERKFLDIKARVDHVGDGCLGNKGEEE